MSTKSYHGTVKVHVAGKFIGINESQLFIAILIWIGLRKSGEPPDLQNLKYLGRHGRLPAVAPAPAESLYISGISIYATDRVEAD